MSATPGPEAGLPARGPAARWVIGGAAGVLLLLALRLADLQILRHGGLADKAERQQHREAQIPARRGEIQDRTGKPLAVTLMVPSIYAEPRRLAKGYTAWRPEIARRLAGALGLDVRETLKDLAKDRSFVWVKRQVGEGDWARVKALRLPGVGMRLEPRRFYPHGASAGPLLGGTGVDGQPLAALELEYQSALAGTPGRQRLTRDARGRGIVEDVDDLTDPVDGATLVTTLDQGLQEITERAMDRLVELCKPKGAVAVVMEPSTGEILAMSSRPGYDPNRLGEVRPAGFQNPAVLFCYEPGSTFKPFIAAPAFAEGKLRPEDRFFCHNGTWHVPGRKPLHDYHPHGWLSAIDVVAQSSNIGIAQIGQRLGMPTIYENLKRFGFGERTGIDLPGEQSGILNPPKKWTGATIYSVPMGHEIAVTPIQLLAAFNVFANEGRWVEPHLLGKVVGPDGSVLKAYEPKPQRQVLDPEVVAGPVREMLKAVVERGTAKGAALRGFTSAGKTGTAQKVGPDGQYLHDAWVSSYVCFAPAERAELTVVIVVDEPHNAHGGYTGGAVAAPAAKEILEAGLGLRARSRPMVTAEAERP